MNVTIDTLEIRSVQLPATDEISALLIVAMTVYIVGTIINLIWQCREPARSLYPYAEMEGADPSWQ